MSILTHFLIEDHSTVLRLIPAAVLAPEKLGIALSASAAEMLETPTLPIQYLTSIPTWAWYNRSLLCTREL